MSRNKCDICNRVFTRKTKILYSTVYSYPVKMPFFLIAAGLAAAYGISRIYAEVSSIPMPTTSIIQHLKPPPSPRERPNNFSFTAAVSVNPRLLAKVDSQLIVQSPSTEVAFRTQMEFVLKHTREYNMGDVSLIVIVVGAVEHRCVSSTNFQEQPMFEQALNNTPYIGYCPDVSRALKVARENVISSHTGRPDVKKMALFLNKASDCGDETSAVDEANKIKLMVSEVVVVSVGAANRTFLDRLASKSDNVLTFSSDLELIDKGIQQIKQITCLIAPKYIIVADIVFIIDSSGSIGQVDYLKELNFVVGLTEHFNIGPNDVQFGVMLFSCTPQMLFNLQIATHATIQQQVLSAQYICGGTDTAAALTEARLKAFNVGARSYSKKIAIVITDGVSNNTAETEQAAAALKGTGVRVIAIGVGSANQVELRAIATTPGDVYYVDTFDVLKTIYERIAELTQARR